MSPNRSIGRKEHPSRAKREFALRYNRSHILQEFGEGAALNTIK
jgi:hypothetical protein